MAQITQTAVKATAKQTAFLAKLTGEDQKSFEALTIREASILIGKALKAQREQGKTGNDRNINASQRRGYKATLKATSDGVKVGDVFTMSWGYDATNNNAFEVVEIVGAHTVKVREIRYKIVDVWSGGMSGQEQAVKGDYLTSSFWHRESKGADKNDENLFTKTVKKYGDSLYIAFGYKSNYHAYLNPNAEKPTYYSEY